MIAMAPISTVPCTIGRSAFWIASNAVRPMPGMLKTVSVRIAPPNRMPRSRPKIVTIGVIAERTPWRKMTRRSLRPLARAVRM